REIMDRRYYKTRINILNSRALAEKVLKTLGLDKDPEFIHSKDPVGKLLSMVKIEPQQESNIAFIFVTGKDPLKITTIANSWVREFIHLEIEKKLGDTKYGIAFLESQLSDILSKLQMAEKELNEFIRENKIVKIPDIETKAEALLENLKAQKSDLEKALAEASKKYKEKHPRIISLTSQLRTVEEKISEETNNRLLLQEKMAEYNILKRKLNTYNSLYGDLLKRARELDVSKKLTVSNIRVIDFAEEPQNPIKPQPRKEILQAIIISLIIGIGLAFLLEYLDSTLKTSDDVEFYVKLPFLGYIPSGVKELKDKKNLEFIAYLKPYSRIAEAFRNLKVSLIFSYPAEKILKTILITSSIASEGKTVVTCNLAIAFAQAKEETLLIDGDMRKGTLSKRFNLKNKKGLSNLLTGLSNIKDSISSTFIPYLSVISCGSYSPNPTELLNSEKLADILNELGKDFKRIIIDAPPILNVSDGLVLGNRCDGLVFIIRAGFTRLRYILEAKKILEKRLKIVGVVLNNVDMEERHYYYYYYYSYSIPKEKT
ncbi:MAG: polysaccharide biosynthesis tyrosine autokinase, partial [Candidatus Aenigmatarchaeota archaeon]